jgi:hypothetical protein
MKLVCIAPSRYQNFSNRTRFRSAPEARRQPFSHRARTAYFDADGRRIGNWLPRKPATDVETPNTGKR